METSEQVVNGQARGRSPEELELAALKQRREDLEEKREARQQLSVEEQIAVTKRALATDEALDKAEQEHGKIGKFIDVLRVDDDTDGRGIILKRPIMTVFRRFQDSGTQETKDIDNLVRPCVIYPSKAEFDGLIEEMPFLLKRCADKVCTLAGVRKADMSAK